MNKQLVKFVSTNIDELVEDWNSSISESPEERLSSFIPAHYHEEVSCEFGKLMVMYLTAPKDVELEAAREFTRNLVRLNCPITFINKAVDTFARITFKRLEDEGIITNDNLRSYMKMLTEWISPLRSSIIKAYSLEWSRTFNLQRVALQELSAPLIPIFDKISVMPLVGAVDTERAKLIIENLLYGVVKHRSEVVLLDITGVPIVDTMVAHHIIQAADAVRLVGAKCMLVGIRPEIAQTIVTLGINLNDFTTTSTLRRGMKEALEYTNRAIVEVE
ncbi:STAS domain-containing protein [Sporosarcina sp. CAU 1771]